MAEQAQPAPDSIRALKPMTAGIVPITADERRGRIAKAQKLMAEQKIDAIFMEGTASSFYFADMRWGQSERTFGIVIPTKGDLACVCPKKFEEDRARELIKFGTEVRTWEEDESPCKVIAGIVKDRGVRHQRIGMEERVRFFIADGVRKEATGFEVDATPVTAGCRIYKSRAEIALMQRANDVTIEAYKAAFKTMRAGMTQGNCRRTFPPRSVHSASLARPACRSASGPLPHGSITPQRIQEGDVVMVDGGTSYSRLRIGHYAHHRLREGQPAPDRRNKELEAQTAAFKAMKLGATCESVDAAARAVIVKAGFGPAYKVPGLLRIGPATASAWRPRVDQLREGEQNAARAGHVLQRRADDRDSRRVRHPPGGLRLLRRQRRALLHEAEHRDRSAFWLGPRSRLLVHSSSGSPHCRRRLVPTNVLNDHPFRDLCEDLQLSPNASGETSSGCIACWPGVITRTTRTRAIPQKFSKCTPPTSC